MSGPAAQPIVLMAHARERTPEPMTAVMMCAPAVNQLPVMHAYTVMSIADMHGAPCSSATSAEQLGKQLAGSHAKQMCLFSTSKPCAVHACLKAEVHGSVCAKHRVMNHCGHEEVQSGRSHHLRRVRAQTSGGNAAIHCTASYAYGCTRKIVGYNACQHGGRARGAQCRLSVGQQQHWCKVSPVLFTWPSSSRSSASLSVVALYAPCAESSGLFRDSMSRASAVFVSSDITLGS